MQNLHLHLHLSEPAGRANMQLLLQLCHARGSACRQRLFGSEYIALLRCPVMVLCRQSTLMLLLTSSGGAACEPRSSTSLPDAVAKSA
jgi:hypothetical protein